MNNLFNHKSILKISIAYAALFIVAILSASIILGIKLAFPKVSSNQVSLPKLESVIQAIDLVTNLTIPQ